MMLREMLFFASGIFEHLCAFFYAAFFKAFMLFLQMMPETLKKIGLELAFICKWTDVICFISMINLHVLLSIVIRKKAV
jgi:hypothetical protein